VFIPARAHAALPSPRGIRAGLSAGAAALAIGLLTGCGSTTPVAPSRAAAPTVDPRLVVRGHDQPVFGMLAGGARLRGTLYPALPGANTVRLRTEDLGGEDTGAPGRAEIVAAMPGMAMHPVTTTLAAHAGRYQGTIALPMFGRYTARIVVTTRRGRRHGTLTLDVPLMTGR